MAETKTETKKRIAVIDRELCKKKKCGYLCAKVCPKNRAGENCVVVDDESGFPVIDEGLCIGCGLCVKACERAGFNALSVVNLPHELEEKPIHRFGVNGFTLFRLPFPVKNEIVGLIGPNGVGKTTALRILSGEVKPNLGETGVGKEAEVSELIKIFRGTELQTYMEKFANKEIKTSYKLQRVDEIPKYYKGKVKNLLEKTDERRILNELLKSLRIEDLMDKKINEVSGGELQRVAIAACLAKDADIYYIDEPTSFLDVFQRLAVAKVIRTCVVNKSIIVVDHDLATLDFLADKIHILYGVPSVYGIVSKPYGVRVGINTFLDGYIKEDNVRIRSEPIAFFVSIIDKKVSQNILVSFKNLKKKFTGVDGFELDIESGDIRKQEALAVFGANALGKTTLAKILAGEISAEGDVDKNIEISYKPQYLNVEKKTVREVLSKITSIESDAYKAEIIRPLELTKLVDKNINELSGGELQRVAIAICLSKEADLYLLDEPSAFLDVEQRLALAKLLSRMVDVKEKSALIIDHDLLFLSQIGARGMVFLGESGVRGYVKEISNLSDAFNEFLKQVGVTFRKDPQTGRPRANKLDSQLDREQKENNKYFYV